MDDSENIILLASDFLCVGDFTPPDISTSLMSIST
jgi:hypothetical protein